MTFDSIYYSPYRIQSDDDDDDAPVTKKHIKELHEKIDNLIASSSSSRSHVTEVAIQKMVDDFTNKHEASITSATAAIDASSKACTAATEKVEKLFKDANIFLESLQGAAETNAEKVNSAITKLTTLFATEQQNFASLRQTLEADHKTFQSNIDERLFKLQQDLATENSVMDALARKTSALIAKNLLLSQSRKEVDTLMSERAVINSCVSDVHSAITNIHEVHDPILNHLVRRTLHEKLAPTLAILSHIEGHPETVEYPKQGGEDSSKGNNQSQPPPVFTAQTKATEPTTGHASGSGAKDKGKKVTGDSDEDEDK